MQSSQRWLEIKWIFTVIRQTPLVLWKCTPYTIDCCLHKNGISNNFRINCFRKTLHHLEQCAHMTPNYWIVQAPEYVPVLAVIHFLYPITNSIPPEFLPPHPITVTIRNICELLCYHSNAVIFQFCLHAIFQFSPW